MTEAREICLVVRGSEVLVQARAGEPLGELPFPSRQDVAGCAGPRLALGDWAGAPAFAARATDIPPPEHLSYRPVRSLFSELSEEALHLVGQALALVEFDDTHRYCGRCGRPTEAGPTGERARVCRSCEMSFYPRIPPAVIVLVEKGDAVLLARGPRFPPGRFGAVAGFVETGETLEAAVQREVAEEVGIAVSDVRYFGSQPWPFGKSLMIGFRARYLSGEIRPDGVEIVEAAWFRRHELPELPPKISMARKLIEAYLAERIAREGSDTDPARPHHGKT